MGRFTIWRRDHLLCFAGAVEKLGLAEWTLSPPDHEETPDLLDRLWPDCSDFASLHSEDLAWLRSANNQKPSLCPQTPSPNRVNGPVSGKVQTPVRSAF